MTWAQKIPPMRVAYFTEVYWPNISGVALTLERTVTELIRRGHGARVYAPSPNDLLPAPDRAEVHRSPSGPLLFDPAIAWARPRHGAILDDLRAFAPDLIHVATEFPMGRAGLRAAKALGVPVIASAHTDYERYAPSYRLQWAVTAGWAYLRNFYARAQVVLAPTRSFETHLRQRGVLNTGRWARGVSTEDFSPFHRSSAFRASLGVGEDDLLLICVTRLAPEKGIPILLEAWHRIAPTRGRTRLALVGSGTLESWIKARVDDRVLLLGSLRGRALSTAYASADIFAFASATETFGNVALEAMASGLACALIGAGGISDIATHEQDALLSPANDVAGLASNLERLIHHAELRRRLSEAARKTALGRDWATVHDNLLLTYAAYRHRAARAA